MGTIAKIVLFTTPIVFIIGLFQFNTFGVFYAPSGEQVLALFASYRGIDYINDMARIAREMNMKTWQDAQNITDLFSFFTVIGDFFNVIMSWIYTIGTFLFLPIYTIGWIIAQLVVAVIDQIGEPETSEAIERALKNSIRMMQG